MKFKIPLLISFLLILTFVSCGYKPSINYASNELKGKVYIDINIDIKNARNSVLIKDQIIALVLNKFKLKLANTKYEADSFFNAKLSSVNHKELLSDTSGFVKIYRESVKIDISYYIKNSKIKTFSLSSYYDFSVDDDSYITQENKDTAISIAINKALSNLFSKIAVNSK